jgi:hypothetical protein
MGYDSDSDDECTSKPPDIYIWQDTNNMQGLESVLNEEVISLWVLVEKVLWKVPPLSGKLESYTEQHVTFRARMNSQPYSRIRNSLRVYAESFRR